MIADPVTTITLTAGTPQSVKFASNYPYYWIDNKTSGNVYARIGGTPVPDSDGTFTIAAGSQLRISGGAFGNDTTLLGSGKVQIIASEIASCPFKLGAEGGGNEISGAPSYSVDAVEYPLLGLNIFGRSVQDGTPSPDAPVDIVSVGDNGFDIISKDDTHFNLLSVRDNGGEIITKQPVSAVVKVGERATFTVAATGEGLTYKWQLSSDGATWYNPGATTAAYSFVAKAANNGLMYRCVITDSSGKSVISDEATLYVLADDYEITTASIATDALPLCGLPVDNGGNYTDKNGQQWICDTLVYNVDGSGKIIKKTGKIIFDGSEDWSKSGVTEIDRYIFRNVSAKKGIRITSGLCNTYIVDVSETSDTELGKILLYPTYYDQISVNFAEYGTSTVETFKDYLKNNPIVLCTDLIEPQEIELTAAEVDALRALQTFDGATNISNSAGAEMSVKYCTNKALSEYVLPIFNGLQVQIDELRAAVLSLGGNV
ncbi:MAG: hypothetical protein ACI4YB_09735 [Oscillospiraceae bacterium]